MMKEEDAGWGRWWNMMIVRITHVVQAKVIILLALLTYSVLIVFKDFVIVISKMNYFWMKKRFPFAWPLKQTGQSAVDIHFL